MPDLNYFLGAERLLTPADMSDRQVAPPRGRPRKVATCEECGGLLVRYSCSTCDVDPKLGVASNPGARTLRVQNGRQFARYLERSVRPTRVS